MRDLLSRIRNSGILLEVVDGELKLFASNANVDKSLLQEIRERKAELVEFLQGSDQAQATGETVHIAPIGQQPDYALSSSQRRLWILSQFDAGNVAYNMPGVYVFDGDLNVTALAKAFEALVERHESLRTIFITNEQGEARQVIKTTADSGFHIAQFDLRGEVNMAETVQQKVQQQFATPFNLAEGPLLRASLIQTGDQQWVFTYMMHHIISDGWSMGVLINELLVLYNAFSNGMVNPFPPLNIHYKDYAAWQQEQLSGESLQQHADYWLKQMEGELPVLDLAGDKPRPAVKTYNGGRTAIMINPIVNQQLKALCQEQGGTLFMGLVAVINTVLYKYTGQQDIVLGTQIAGRVNEELESQIGFYLNTLALRTRFAATDSFKNLLIKVKQVTLGGYQHQVYPFDELVNALPLQRDLGRNPLFDVSVVLQNADAGNTTGKEQQSMGTLNVSAYDGQQAISSLFDLAFDFTEVPEGLQTMITFNSDIYNESTVHQLLLHFQQVMQAAVDQPDLPLNQLEYLSAIEKAQLLEDFNSTEVPYPSDKAIAALFAEQVTATPTAIAVVSGNTTLTYAELNEKAERLAHYLQQECGIATGDYVGLLLERDTLLPIAILGILKAGAAYVPIDAEHPKARQSFVASDTGIKALITQTDYLFDIDYFTGTIVALDVQLDSMEAPSEAVVTGVDADSPAYVMYTSGSTGKPKGVLVPQKAVVRLVKNIDYVDLTGDEVLLSTGAISFDATTFEYWSMLLNGGRLILCGKEVLLDETKLAATIQAQGVDVMWFTSGWLNQLVEKAPAVFAGLKWIITGGDRLSPLHVRKLKELYPNLTVYNAYGPTENTTFSTMHPVVEVAENTPIGKPINNSTVYILNADKQLLPVGVVGEICVGGDGLALGYLHQPELTEEKFIQNPFKKGERIYKTGDLGKWLPDGNIAFIGRRDEQVKVRGYRIELGEIEALLQNHPVVEAAVVMARPNKEGEKEIIAYIVSKEPLTATVLATYIGASLPDYMVPAHFVQLEVLPLNANGKVDKHQLPDPLHSAMNSGVEYVAPRNETEEKLVAIWEEILDRSPISVKDNFFDLGGHSLRATRLSAQLHKEFNVKVELKDLFAQPVLEDQALIIEQAQKSTFVAIEPLPEQENYALSSSQRRLWILSQFEESNVAYNVPGVYVFEGPMDIAALQSAFDTLMERHESLRTVFTQNENGEIRQIIKPISETGFCIHVIDLREQEQMEEKLHQSIAAASSQPFNLATGPLIRATLYQVAENNWVFSYCLHHIISDGWSMGILMNELFLFYNVYANGQDNLLPSLRIQYKDYAAWQQAQLSGDALRQHKAYWLNQFAGELPVLELPGDNVRPPIKTYNGGTIAKVISAPTTTGIKSISQQGGGTLFMGLVAAVNALLYRYTGQEDIIIGSPIAGREHADLHDQIGFYLNTLALRTRFSGGDSYQSMLDKVQAITMEAYEHQVYPFDELVDDLSLQRDMSRSALFDVMVILQNNESKVTTGATAEAGGDTLKAAPYGGGEPPVSKFDITFNFTEAGDELHAVVDFNSDIYHVATIERMLNHLEQLMQAVVQQPSAPLNKLDYLSTTEKEQLLLTFNDTHVDYPQDTTLVDWFETQVLAMPDNIAVAFEDTLLTYQQLNEQANQLAYYLRHQYQVQADDRVAICLQRSHWMMVAIMGIIKSGGAYIPIDPDYPQERIDFLIKDSGCKALIDEQFIQRFEQEQVQLSVDNPTKVAGVDNLAYVIYTSGSTGLPKGVMIEHRNIVNYTHWVIDRHHIQPGESTVLLSSITFDGVLTGLFPALLSGSAMHVLSKETLQSPTALASYIKDKAITFIKITPPQLKLLVADEESFATLKQANNLRLIFSGGEAINRADVQKIQEQANHITVVNHYGPTETTVGTISAKVDSALTEIPVGFPISNAQAYILDTQQQLVPVGVLGEICISGRGLARGYLNNPDLTAAKYIANPFKDGERMYKTGDIGRWQPDGKIVFLGRRDHQVKVRGYRIELGEVEAILQQHLDVSAAVVLAKLGQGGENELVAYLISSQQLNIQGVRGFLKLHLPDYMVPAHYVQLESFPLNNSGKVDRKALPAPDGLSLASVVEYVAPRNDIETTLVDIWSELLGREKDKISVKDNFFELGGHSLKATRLVGRIHKELEVKLPLQTVFIKAVLEEQAQEIEQAGKTQYMAIEPLPQQPHYPMSPSQRRLWVLSQFEEGNIAYNMPGVYLFEGDINQEALAKAFSTLIERHESLRTVFREDENGEVRQFILPPTQTGFTITYHNLTGTTGQEAQVQALIQATATTPINLAMGPLLRVNLYEIDGGKWVFNYVIHHIISDGVSMEILFSEVLQLYSAYVNGGANPLQPLRIQYKDFADWQLKQLSGESLKQHEGYWLQQFAGEIPVLDLPGDKVRPAMKSYNGGAVTHFINPEITGELKKLSQEQGATLFMGLLATVNTLLFKYTDQQDIIVGTQIAGREHADLENQIGFYLNTLALRTQFSASDSFNILLGNVKDITLGAYQHQVYPFDELVNALPLRRDLSRNALYDVSLVLHNTELDDEQKAAPELGGLQISAYDGGGAAPTAKFDLAFDFTETEGGMLTSIVYNSDIYNHDTAMRMMAHLQQLLQAIAQQPNLPIEQLDYVSTEEKQQLLQTFNDSAMAYPSDQTVAALFEAQVTKTPDATALVFENHQYTYQQLNEQADKLAHFLITQYQIQPDDTVGILLDRSDSLIIAILGILKAGAAYVPIDPDYPRGRKAFICSDTAAKVLITHSGYMLDVDYFNGSIVALDIQLDEMEAPTVPLTIAAGPNNLAYVMYTSGSTGNPKGVLIENRSVVRLVKGANFINLTGKEILLSTGAVSFDATTFEYWSMLLNGGTLVMCSKETLLNDDKLVTTVRENKVDTMWFTSGWLNQLVEKTLPVSEGLTTILAGGDKLSPVHISALKGHYPSLAIVNGYGPTENTTFSLTYPVQTVSDRIPIGKPISNSTVYIINRNQLVPVGVVGEICVGGDGLARGYLNQPDLTAEKFVSNPFVPGTRMYRTGDMGRWLPDGNIEFMGRKDEQVKIRGYRIELGEIENSLLEHPKIDNAVVVVKSIAEGEKEMVAYVAAKEPLNTTELMTHLGQHLPAYMVPSYFVQLKTLPLTSNGKVDKKQLPDPDGMGMGTGVEYVPPSNETEEKLVEIWHEILGRDKIGIKDNFFDLGGHSLKATQLISKINMVFGVGISIQTVFQEPTIESIGQRIVFIQTQSKQKEDMDDMQEIEI